MKKIFLILFTGALTASLVACSGAKKTEESVAPETTEITQEAETKQEEEVAPATKTPEESLKEFEAYVKEYAEAYNNKLKDVQKWQSLAMRSQQEVADMERLKIDFDKNQLKRYEKAKKIVEQINSGK
jgi:hypothetical protein